MKWIASLITVLLTACATQPQPVQKCDMEQMRARAQAYHANNPPAAHNSKGMSAP